MIKNSIYLFIFFCFLSTSLLAEEVAEHGEKAHPHEFGEGKTNHYLSIRKGRQMRLAEEVKKELPPHQRDFVEKYERVKLYKDEDLLAELVHPASKACEDDSNTDYFNELRLFYLHESLPKGYRMEILPVAADKQWPLRNRLGTPLPPTHVMYMEFKVADLEEDGLEIEGLQRFLREETFPELRMYELVRCPSEEDLKAFRESAAEPAGEPAAVP